MSLPINHYLCNRKKYADVNLFRNTVNDVRNLSTCPGKQLTTLSGKEQKNVNQNQ